MVPNQETPQTLPNCTTSNVQLESKIPSASSLKQLADFRNASMHQASLQESLHTRHLDDVQLALAKAIHFSRSAMMMVDNAH